MINHSVGQYVFEQSHTNGVESFWSLLKRGYVGIYHYISAKHLHGYVDEYAFLVCMAFIEYFAFEAQSTNDTALTNFRNLARFGLETFIYQALDYQPSDPWMLHNERVPLLKDAVSAGYFNIFKAR